jgi:hypothetical protein
MPNAHLLLGLLLRLLLGAAVAGGGRSGGGGGGSQQLRVLQDLLDLQTTKY